MKTLTGEVRLSFLGHPEGKMRHRTGKGRTYNPQKELEDKIRLEALLQFNDPPLSGPLQVEIVATFPRPRGHFGTGKNYPKVKRSAPLYPEVKPDFDNIGKLYCDALNGLLYRDDAIIVDGRVKKVYSDDPDFMGGVTMTIKTIGD